MTRRELELLESDFDESSIHDRVYQRRQAPRRGVTQFAKQRRTPQIPLGMNARGARRSTFRSLSRGKIRAVAMSLPNHKTPTPTSATPFSI
ncbi:MAG: hypothetical protein K8T91_07320 [Planctomycetes bacterium]|nr:hypothetical protein [Planctomycetota bacterium]